MSADRETRAHTAGKWLLAFVVPASAMAIGSLHATTLIVISLLAAVSCALLWIDPPRRTSRASKWVLIAFAILMGATILQSIPLPASFVAVIAPANADVWARALTPLREAGPSWHPISVAPPATHVEILKGALYGCVFLAALRVALVDGGSRFLESVVIASACLLAVTTLAHTAVHAEKVFGIYEPREVQGYFAHRIGPLLNPNHVAAYCNVGALVAAGVALKERRWNPRALAVGAAVLLAGTSVWASSRGGTGSLLVGAVLLTGLAIYRGRRRHTGGQAELAIVLVALVAAGALVGVSASDIARADLAGRDLSKIEIVQMALRLVPLSPVVGVGRGAFETMFPFVREGTTYFTFVRAENIVAQWTTEWGVPVAVVALGMLAIALRPGVILRAERPALGAWVAIVVAVLHDLVDFHLEVPGVLVLVSLCAAVVVGGRALATERRSEERTRRIPRSAAFAAAGCAFVAALLTVPHASHSLSDDREAIAEAAVSATLPALEFVDLARATMLRYPAEPFVPLAGAIHAQVIGESVVPWIGRALERYPTFGRAHLVLARSLAPRHRAQARLEYRLAYASDTNLLGTVAREAPRLVDGRNSALDLVSEGPGGEEMLESLGATLIERLPATSLAVDTELLRRNPAAKGPLQRRVRAVMSDLANDHPWCSDRHACAQHGIAAAEILIEREPDACAPRELLARLQIKTGERDRALDELSRSLDSIAERATCLRALVHLSLENGEKRRADEALQRATASGCGTSAECVDLYAWAASTEESRGNPVQAISFHKRAADLAPDSDAHLIRVAELSAQAGLVGEALDAYNKLAARHPENDMWRARAKELRAKAASEQRIRTPP